MTHDLPGTINTPVGPFLYFDRTSSSFSFVSPERFISVAGEVPVEEHRRRDFRPHFRRGSSGGRAAAVDPLFRDQD